MVYRNLCTGMYTSIRMSIINQAAPGLWKLVSVPRSAQEVELIIFGPAPVRIRVQLKNSTGILLEIM